MKNKLLTAAVICALTLGIGVVGFDCETFGQGPPGGNCYHMNGGTPGWSPPPSQWPPFSRPWS